MEPSIGGHVDLLLLATLRRGPLHGYAIAQEVQRRTDGRIEIPEGTVYPALYRLERQRLVRSRTEVVEGRRRRVYALTGSGEKAALQGRKSWRRLVAGMNAVLGSA